MLNGHANKHLSNGAHNKDDSGEGGEFSLGRMQIKDIKLIRRAIERGWPVKRAVRKRICKGLDDAFDGADADTKARIAGVFVRMDEANLKREEFDDKRQRLDDGDPTENLAHSYKVTFGDEDRTSTSVPETARRHLE